MSLVQQDFETAFYPTDAPCEVCGATGMLENDIRNKLEAVQARRLVALLCRRTGHGRAWFYYPSGYPT